MTSERSDHLTDLERLQRLRESGALDETEFAREKARLMAEAAPASEPKRAAYFALPVFGVVIVIIVVVGFVALVWSLLPGHDKPVVVPTPAPSALASPAPVSQSARLAAAVAVAFPRGNTAEDKDGDRYTFADHKLIDVPFGPVLVSEGRVKDFSHISAGRLDVAYLQSSGAGFTLAHAYPAAVKIGSFGQMSEWSVSDKFADVPTIDAEGGFTGQGYTCGAAILTELRPDGPAEVATIRTSYDNSGAAVDGEKPLTIEGKIANIEKNRGFDVRYTGTKTFTEHWLREGDRYVRQGATQLPEC